MKSFLGSPFWGSQGSRCREQQGQRPGAQASVGPRKENGAVWGQGGPSPLPVQAQLSSFDKQHASGKRDSHGFRWGALDMTFRVNKE